MDTAVKSPLHLATKYVSFEERKLFGNTHHHALWKIRGDFTNHPKLNEISRGHNIGVAFTTPYTLPDKLIIDDSHTVGSIFWAMTTEEQLALPDRIDAFQTSDGILYAMNHTVTDEDPILSPSRTFVFNYLATAIEDAELWTANVVFQASNGWEILSSTLMPAPKMSKIAPSTLKSLLKNSRLK